MKAETNYKGRQTGNTYTRMKEIKKFSSGFHQKQKTKKRVGINLMFLEEQEEKKK